MWFENASNGKIPGTQCFQLYNKDNFNDFDDEKIQSKRSYTFKNLVIHPSYAQDFSDAFISYFLYDSFSINMFSIH